MKNQEFSIPCHGIRLHAKLDFPREEKEQYPLVIIIHGVTGHMEERHIVEEARDLNEAGYATLRAELYGHGKSEGSFHDHTMLLWLQELLEIVDYAGRLPFSGHLYLTGHSQGGAAAVLAAAMKQDQLRAVILQAPALVLRDDALRGSLFGDPFDPSWVPDEMLIGEEPVSGNYIRVNQMLPFEEAVRRFEKPVLIIHGDADETVPYSYAVQLEKQYARAQLVTLPGDNHVFDFQLEMVTAAMREFLDRMEKSL